MVSEVILREPSATTFGSQPPSRCCEPLKKHACSRPLRFQLKQLLEHQQALHIEKIERQQKELVEEHLRLERFAENEKRERKKQSSHIVRRQSKDLWQYRFFDKFDGFSVPMKLEISVVSTKFVKISFPKSSYYVFVIHVKTTYGQWLCARRYSEFLSFYSDICKRHPSLKLPSFPKKSPFSKLHSSEILEERKNNFHHLLQCLKTTKVCKEDGFWCFIGVPPLRYMFGTHYDNELMGYNMPSVNAFEDECQTIDISCVVEFPDSKYFVAKIASILQAIAFPKGYFDKHLPPIDEFICSTIRGGNISFSAIIVAFIYLQRLRVVPKYVIGNIQLLWTVALTVSTKFCSDEPIRPTINQWFSKSVMFAKEEEFLNALRFDLNVTFEQYLRHVSFLEEYILRINSPLLPLNPPPDS